MPTAGVTVRTTGRSGRVGATRPLDDGSDDRAVEPLRRLEYARLDAANHAYLDYTGAGLHAESQIRAHHELLRDRVLGNPHSEGPASRASTELADRGRRAILEFAGADPDEYVVIFTANASAALRLVGESYPFAAGHGLLLTADNHNSVNGIREFAGRRGAEVTYLPLRATDLRHDADEVRAALDAARGGPGLFAYPAQSNYSGVRHPLDWIGYAHERGWDVLVDAAAYVPTARLDLNRWRPDFVSVSWYKAFGYPTGIGSLIARREALSRLERPWFAGGTISMASVLTTRHTLGRDETSFEDGTIDFLGLPAIEIGLHHLESVGVDRIHDRVARLTERLIRRLEALRHGDGAPLVRLYGPRDVVDRGGTIPFNVLDERGGFVDHRIVEAAAARRNISIRSGCFCNPGASETARGITAAEMEAVFALGRRHTVDDLSGIMPGKALGAVRASLGIVTTERDLDRLVGLIGSFASR